MLPVIFDLDGTLIDSDPDIRAALNRVLAAQGHEPLSEPAVRGMIGDGAAVLVQRAFGAYGVASTQAHLAAFLADYEAHAVVETVAYEGIVGALTTLQARGHAMAVCTNKPAEAAVAILAKLGLAGYFQAVTGGNSTPFRKPDPRHLAATLAAMGAERAIMVGDHANDMDAAAGLDLPSIFCAWGYGSAAGTRRAESPAQIPALVAELVLTEPPV
jgi:phosphoglycolate phosphatase